MTAKKATFEVVQSQVVETCPVASKQPLEQTESSIVIKRSYPKITDVEEIERAIQLAAVSLRPDELTVRRLIWRLMPSLYTLRQNGFSYVQLVRLLNDVIGSTSLRIPTATLKAYYNQFIGERLEDCGEHHQQALKVIEQVNAIAGRPD